MLSVLYVYLQLLLFPIVAESIKNLIQRGEIIHAIGHICDLKLTDKFSPVDLLVEYLADARSFTDMVHRKNKYNEAKVLISNP